MKPTANSPLRRKCQPGYVGLGAKSHPGLMEALNLAAHRSSLEEEAPGI